MQVREDLAPLRRRAAVLFILSLAALVVLELRLLQLQIVNGSYWRQMADSNRLRRLPMASFRGRVFDRHGRVLADTVPTWDLLVFPQEARDLHAVALYLARLGVEGAATINRRLAEGALDSSGSILLAENLSWAQVASIRAHQSNFPELTAVSRFRRHYPCGGAAAHAVGYLRPVTQAERDLDPSLAIDALVGATGVEELRNQFLAGRDGERWAVVNAFGQELGVVREVPLRSGNDLGITLDADLQEVAAQAMGDAAGAVVALDPTNGAVRVLYSAPSFDPDLFAGRLSRDEWEALRTDPRHPLQNRCTQGAYPPGSTIKPFYAIGGLTDGVIDPQWGVSCSGMVTLYGHPFRCWVRHGHGGVGLLRSLEASCDTFYYLLGQRLGIEGMAKWLGRFGFGQLTGSGLAGERSGLVGTPEWSRRVRKQPWYAGDAVSVSIGQGPLIVTTLQLARGFCALANGGRLVTPHLVYGDTGPPIEQLPVNPAYLGMVVEGLKRVVNGGEGTARRLAGLPIAGKTGTAQVVALQEGVTVQQMDPNLRHHAWFVGWGPVDAPTLLVAVLVEHGGGGGSVAAPVAGAVLRAHLGLPPAASPAQPSPASATSERATDPQGVN